MPGHAACAALLDVPTQCFSATGDNRAPRFGLRTGERVRREIFSAVSAEDVGQFDSAARGHALALGRER